MPDVSFSTRDLSTKLLRVPQNAVSLINCFWKHTLPFKTLRSGLISFYCNEFLVSAGTMVVTLLTQQLLLIIIIVLLLVFRLK